MQLSIVNKSHIQNSGIKIRNEKKLSYRMIESSYRLPLEIKEVKVGLHETAEGITLRPIYRITWGRKTMARFKWLRLGSKNKSEKFIKLPLYLILEPQEAGFGYTSRIFPPDMEEKAVFLSTRLTDTSLTVISAMRTGEGWFELNRWQTSWSELGLSRTDICSF
jgi:hypothetical protein